MEAPYVAANPLITWIRFLVSLLLVLEMMWTSHMHPNLKCATQMKFCQEISESTSYPDVGAKPTSGTGGCGDAISRVLVWFASSRAPPPPMEPPHRPMLYASRKHTCKTPDRKPKLLCWLARCSRSSRSRHHRDHTTFLELKTMTMTTLIEDGSNTC